MRFLLPLLMIQGCTFVLYDERCDTADVSVVDDTGEAPLLWASLGAGSIHSCGLDEVGEISCWGGDPEGQTDAPEGSFGALALGHAHSCALDVDGAVHCWGRNDEGQNDLSGTFASISAGGAHTCGLDEAGALECVGRNDEGQTDAPEGPFKAVSSGWSHTCAVQVDDTVVCWGSISPTKVDTALSTIDSGQGFSCGLDLSGSMVCWGETAVDLSEVPSDETFVELAAGAKHVCARAEEGLVRCWGANDAGQLDAPQVPVHGLVSGAGSLHSCAVDGPDGSLGEARCWGLDAENQLIP